MCSLFCSCAETCAYVITITLDNLDEFVRINKEVLYLVLQQIKRNEEQKRQLQTSGDEICVYWTDTEL